MKCGAVFGQICTKSVGRRRSRRSYIDLKRNIDAENSVSQEVRLRVRDLT